MSKSYSQVIPIHVCFEIKLKFSEYADIFFHPNSLGLFCLYNTDIYILPDKY